MRIIGFRFIDTDSENSALVYLGVILLNVTKNRFWHEDNLFAFGIIGREDRIILFL
jgi:hypothetical protein